MTMKDSEALKERARDLYTVPYEIGKKVFDALPSTSKQFLRDHYKRSGQKYKIKGLMADVEPADRFRILECLGRLNGISFALVTPKNGFALVEVHFFNRNHFSKFVAADPLSVKAVFVISGGNRIPAGRGPNRVKVVKVEDTGPDTAVLRLTIKPVGDYSTYTLRVVSDKVDPLFSEIAFKFRPACFNNCPPDWTPPAAPKPEPPIDYLVKDYESFKHTMITAMMNRVPGWEATSEADLDQVLLEMFAVAADELSDYQDRVMNEAYLATARKRVSLARHARLMDYHVHQGNQASTWLALEVTGTDPLDLPEDLSVWAERDISGAASKVFMTHEAHTLHPLLNEIKLYTWDGSRPGLEAGSTTADLLVTDKGDKTSAQAVAKMIQDGRVRRLLIQERLNPDTGKAAGTDPTKRQLLRLVTGRDGEGSAQALRDPVQGKWLVRVHWQDVDRLTNAYRFLIGTGADKVAGGFTFHGNLVTVYYGRLVKTVFRDQPDPLEHSDERHYERHKREWAICRLPEGPLAYKETPPGGEYAPVSTLRVLVKLGEGDGESPDPGSEWTEVISLVNCDDSDEKGSCFIVETDEMGNSLIRFGDGENGKQLPDGAAVECRYQIGSGLDGNIGADKLRYFGLLAPSDVSADASALARITKCWNPFDVTNGRAPEPVAEIIRRVQEAYSSRQSRAITLKDYEMRAQEVAGVSRATARYAWTGAWRTVRIGIDPLGTTNLRDELRGRIARHLEAFRLLGEDLEIRPPRFVPLEIDVTVCIHTDYWAEDLEYILEQEFSDGYTPDGRKAFFHPDLWTFGQGLKRSQIIGHIQAIEGVDHVVKLTMARWNEDTPGTLNTIEVGTNEIIQVENDPDHMERGRITFTVRGGRR
jgi:hypothetical protein